MDLAPCKETKSMKMLIRSLGLSVARSVGMKVKDFESGKSLGRALILPWRGKIHIIGLETAVRAMFQPQKRLTYWKQEIVFTEHPTPDFPNIRKAEQRSPSGASDS